MWHNCFNTEWFDEVISEIKWCRFLTRRVYEQDAQLSQRDRAAGWVSYVQKWKTGTGRQYLRPYISLVVYSIIVTFWASITIEFRENAKWGLLRHSRSFKVIKVGTNQKPLCDFLLVINSNWQPISYRSGVITAYCSNFGHFAFLSHPLGGGSGTMYDVHLGLIGKRVMDYLLVLIELFSLDVTAWRHGPKYIENRRFRSNMASLTQNFR